jgi:hypothetical protein
MWGFTPMKQLIQKLGPVVLGGAAIVGNLRKMLAESRPNGVESRVDAIENALEIQTTLNESVDVQMKLIHALLEKAHKRLQLVLLGLIATATLAAFALAMAWMR